MENPSSPACFTPDASGDITIEGSNMCAEKKLESDSALLQSLQRQVAKLRNDLKTANTQLSLVRQQKTKAIDQLKAVDQKFEKKIKHLEKEAAEQKKKADETLQLAKKIQDWNEEQSKQCTALVKSNEQCISEKFELQLQIEAMDCMLKNITPDMVRNSAYQTHPLSWYKECMAEWRVNLAKVEGRCKALEEALKNEKKSRNKELSSVMVKGESLRQEIVGNILIGLFQVSGLNEEETINQIAKDHASGIKSTEVRDRMVKLLADILSETGFNSTAVSDPKVMYDALVKEFDGLPDAEKMAIYANPTHRLNAVSKPVNQPKATSQNINTNVPSRTKDNRLQVTIPYMPPTTTTSNPISTTPKPEPVKLVVKGPTMPTSSSLLEELPIPDSPKAPAIPPKDPKRLKIIVGKAKSAISGEANSTLNILRDEGKANGQEDIKIAIADSRDVQIQKLLEQQKKAETTLQTSLTDNADLKKKLSQFQEVHCSNFSSKCTHMSRDITDITRTTPCSRRDCIERLHEVKRLEKTVEEMDEYINVIAPMATIGSAVRIQFLEEARAALEGDEPNECIIREGILAARGANGEVDNNLFAGSDTIDEHPLFQVFGIIYDSKPRDDWEDLPELLKRTIDCQATVRFAKNLPATQEMLTLLEGHEKLCGKLIGRFKKWVDGKTELFEANVNHWFLLDRLEWLTDEILLFDGVKSVERFNEFMKLDGNDPKVRVKRWPGAEEDFNSPGFGFIATVKVGTSPADLTRRNANIENIKRQFAALDAMEGEVDAGPDSGDL